MTRLAWLLGNFALLGLASAGPLDGWNWLYPQPTGCSFHGVAHGDGQFIAVGEGTTIARSTNGTNWTLVRDRSGSTNLTAVTWGDGLFVAVGQQGLVMTSPDGTNWARRQPFAKDLLSVAFGAGRFVAVGGDYSTNWMQSSPDGVVWTVVTNLPAPPFGNAGPLVDITWGERFVAVTTKYMILLSTNGQNWERTTNTPPNYYELAGVTYGNGTYVAAGPYTILYSTNATRWQQSQSSIGHYHSDVAYGNGRYVIVGDTGVAGHSSSAVSWSGLPWSNNSGLNDIVHADGRFVAVGNYGLLASSVTGTNWSLGNGPNFISSVACGPEGCVVADNDGSHRATTNFTDWTILGTNQWNGLDHIGGRFIAPANGGVIHVGTGLDNWTSIPTATTNRLYNGAFGHGRYIVSGANGTLVISSDAIDWTVLSLGVTNNLGNIAFGNGRFVTKEYSGGVAVSTNGTDWVFPPVAPEAVAASQLTFGNGIFLSLNSTGTVARTTDGFVWSRWHVRTNALLVDLTFAHGLFLIAGYEAGQAFLLASRDGTNWSHHAVPQFQFVAAGTAAFGNTVVLNDYRRFVRSDLFPSLAIQHGTPLQLSLTGAVGNYQIEASDQVDGPWQVITNLTAPAQWTVESGSRPKRFYRALLP